MTPRPDWLPFEEYPFESRLLELDGHRLHYLDEGSGPLLLLVHAGPAWSFVYRDLILALRGRFRTITLDFPDSGLSRAAPGYRPGLAAASVVLADFVAALGLRNVTLVAHDLGGPVALHAAAALAEPVRGIVLNGSFGWSLNRHSRDGARFLRVVGSPLFRFIDARTGLLSRASSGPAGVGRRLSPEGRRAYRGPFRSRRSRLAATAMLAAAVREDAFLDAVEQAVHGPLNQLPVLLSYGEHDPGRRAGFQARFEGIFPYCRSQVVAGARHFPQTEAPFEIARHIADW